MQNKRKRKRKSKYNIKRIILAVLVLLAIIAGLVFLCVFLSNKVKNRGIKTDGAQNGTQGTVREDEQVSKGEYISIAMDDCALYVGTVLKLTCTSNPEEAKDKVMWSSSDESVVKVMSDGTISVLAAGKAAITAKYGMLSDSVVIEAVLKGNAPDNEELPVFTVENNETVIVPSDSSPKPPAPTETITDSAGGVHSGVVDAETHNETTSEKKPSSSGEGGSSVSESTTAFEPESPMETTGTASPLKEQMNVHLGNLGFVPYLENTFVYYEDGNYLGEAIVNEDNIHIYIMTRTSAFDNVMLQLIECVVPGKSNEIYAEFIRAAKDATITSGGHRVRIIAPKKGDHSQLIIYF